MTSRASDMRQRVATRLSLSGMAGLGAMLGLGNITLTWLVFGRSVEADIWLLALSIALALSQLSQLGVEQVVVFSAEAHATSAQRGQDFDRDSMSWALGFGLAFALLALLVTPALIPWFAAGFGAEQRNRLGGALAPLMLLVALAPGMMVLGQQLMLAGRQHLAVCVLNLNALVQFIALLACWVSSNTSPDTLALAFGSAAALLGLAVIASLGPPRTLRVMPDFRALLPFIRSSVAMRGAHSAHNFVVVLLINSALTAGAEGTVAVYQYARKVADGLTSIAIGPHQAVYLAALARAWAHADRLSLRRESSDYLWTSLLLLTGATLLLSLVAGAAATLAPTAAKAIGIDGGVMLAVLVLWQALVAIESIPVAVLSVDRRAGSMLCVNAVFALGLYAVLTWLVVPPHGGVPVVLSMLFCQIGSTVLFALVASRCVRHRFGS